MYTHTLYVRIGDDEAKMMELRLRRGNLIKEEVARHLSYTYHEVKNKKNLSSYFFPFFTPNKHNNS